MQKTFKDFIAKPVNEGVSGDAKAIMQEINKQMKFLKQDVKESDTNSNWIGRLKNLQALLDRSVKLAQDTRI